MKCFLLIELGNYFQISVMDFPNLTLINPIFQMQPFYCTLWKDVQFKSMDAFENWYLV